MLTYTVPMRTGPRLQFLFDLSVVFQVVPP